MHPSCSLINYQLCCKCQNCHSGPQSTQNPQPHVYHLISFSLAVDLFSLPHSNIAWEPEFKLGLSSKLLYLLHTTSRNPQNRCPKKAKGSSEFLSPILHVWNPSWSFPFYRKDKRQERLNNWKLCVVSLTILIHFSLLRKIWHRQVVAASKIYLMNSAHYSHHVNLLQEILVIRKSSQGWEVRKSTKSWQNLKRYGSCFLGWQLFLSLSYSLY